MLLKFLKKFQTPRSIGRLSKSACELIADVIMRFSSGRIEKTQSALKIITSTFDDASAISDEQVQIIREATANTVRCVEVIELFAAEEAATFDSWKQLSPDFWLDDKVQLEAVELIAVLCLMYNLTTKEKDNGWN
ncbi:MAG: hypothetical protein V1738_01610 [Patescibacteria group bacterium]